MRIVSCRDLRGNITQSPQEVGFQMSLRSLRVSGIWLWYLGYRLPKCFVMSRWSLRALREILGSTLATCYMDNMARAFQYVTRKTGSQEFGDLKSYRRCFGENCVTQSAQRKNHAESAEAWIPDVFAVFA